MGETNGNHRSIFSMRSTAAPPPSRVPRGRTQMAKSIARFLVAVMAVAAMALASVAGTGLAQARTNTPTDRAALVALYNATSGDNWANNTNWGSDMPLRGWHGVTTDSDGRVRRLDLSGNELTGCIPEGLRDVANNDFQILGLDFCEVDSSDPLIVRYDASNNGTIEKIEVIAAINDYLFGAGDEAISKSDVIKLINLYLFG